MASYSWEILTVSSGSWSCQNSQTGSACDLGLAVGEDQSNEFPDLIELVFEFELIFDLELFEGVVVIELAFVFKLFQGVVVFELVFELFEGVVVTLRISLNFFRLQTRTRPPYEAQAYTFDFEPLLRTLQRHGCL